MAEDSKNVVIDKIVNPTPGLIVVQTVNVDSQLNFEKNYLNVTVKLRNSL